MAETKDLSFIDDIKELNAMPKISRDLMVMLQAPSSSLKEIIEKIKLDPALASFVLKTSNSAFYGIKQEIRTLQAAVKMLGLAEIRSILMSYFLRHLYGAAGEKYVMDYLWEHSISVAIFAKELSLYLNIKKEGAYLAGLLHDIGKLVLNLHDPEAYEKIIKKVDEKGENFEILEEEVFHFTHTDTGYYLVDKWDLSEFIKNAILFHHYFISYTGDDPIVGVVAFANQLVHKYIDRKPVLVDIYLREYNLTNEDLEFFAEKTIGIAAQYHLMLALQHSKKEKSFVTISKREDTIQPDGKEIKEETHKDLKPEISKKTYADGVKLFMQLEKVKKELFELKKIYHLFDYVPLKVLQNHAQMLKLFGESVNILIKDPKMSAKLNLSKIAQKAAAKKPTEKKAVKKGNEFFGTASDEMAYIIEGEESEKKK